MNQSTDIRPIKELITDKNKEISDIRVKKIAKQIKSNDKNVTKIWEVKTRIEQKTKNVQIKHQIKNHEEETLKQPDELLITTGISKTKTRRNIEKKSKQK